MKVSDFHYDLPPELIAQQPLADRSASRMLVVDRATGAFADRSFRDFPSYIREADKLVVNNTRVIPARLIGERSTGGKVEALLVKRVDAARWEALLRPARRVRVGDTLSFPGDLHAKVVAEGERGLRTLELSSEETLERSGAMPLPPYIKRTPDAADRERYQTVYADRPGSAAAPTAGLHFTPEILAEIEAMGAIRVEITLEVGLGTFQPIGVDTVEEHRLHAERYVLSAEAAEQLNQPGRVVAVGTTSIRTLEHCGRDKPFVPSSGETELFLYPGYEFQVVDSILTNFHLPESSLLMLVSAFAGRELTLAAYRHAVTQKYRFYSYGDCMLII